MRFAKKSLGQNFLIDNNVIKKIINAVEPQHILSSISVEDFINMDQKRFDKFKNV